MLAAAPAAQQILLSTPAAASGEFDRAWTSGEDWERVQITADQCLRISVGPDALRTRADTDESPTVRTNAIASTVELTRLIVGSDRLTGPAQWGPAPRAHPRCDRS